MDDLSSFDSVFSSVFGDLDSPDDRDALLQLPGPRTPAAGLVNRAGNRSGPPQTRAKDLPWATRAATEAQVVSATIQLPDVLPSRIAALADEPFDEFDPDDLRLRKPAPATGHGGSSWSAT
jgi:uncharacterized protein with von Willebrand factor type A (vWA) domain